LYGKSKLLISEKIKDNQDVVCLNIFACYGYDERETRFPTYAIKQNLNHLPIEINRDVVFDYLFIEDLYKIIKYFIKNQPKENMINVTPINSIKLSEIAQIVNKISDYKSEIVFKTDTLGMEYTGDNTRLLNNIPDFEFTSIENGIKELYDYIKNKI
jgi:GDP-L-fucose synthase